MIAKGFRNKTAVAFASWSDEVPLAVLECRLWGVTCIAASVMLRVFEGKPASYGMTRYSYGGMLYTSVVL